MGRAARTTRLFAGALILLLAFIAARMGLPEAYTPLLRVLPEALALLILILSWRYRRGRMALVAVLLALLNLLARSPALPASVLLQEPAWTLFSRIFLINLGILALLPDRPVFHRSTMLQAFLLLLEALILFFRLPDLAALTARNFPEIRALLGTPQAQGLLLLLVLLCILSAAVLRRGAFEVAMIWVTLAFFLFLRPPGGAFFAGLYLGAGELLLLLSLVEDSYRLAYVDPLTGLEGRRALDEKLRSLGGSYALAMVDIDHFKKFNDRWGHESGDQALRMVAAKLAGVGGGGRAYRYGGEEFTIVFAGLEKGEARKHLEQLRKEIAAAGFGIRSAGPSRKGGKGGGTLRKVRITVSMGLAVPGLSAQSAETVLKAADKALYRAKKAGRNRVAD